MRQSQRLIEKPQWRDKSADEAFKRRERETLAHNSRMLDEALAREEKVLDAAIARLRPWSDRWVGLMNHANALRRRRVALVPQMKLEDGV
jgi:hypothetical protein